VSTDARRTAARIAAPAVFLLAVTVAVVLVRTGLQTDERPQAPPPAVTAAPETVVVRKGDTLESIAAAAGTTVEALRRLNPAVDPVQLTPGRRVRVR